MFLLQHDSIHPYSLFAYKKTTKRNFVVAFSAEYGNNNLKSDYNFQRNHNKEHKIKNNNNYDQKNNKKYTNILNKHSGPSKKPIHEHRHTNVNVKIE